MIRLSTGQQTQSPRLDALRSWLLRTIPCFPDTAEVREELAALSPYSLVAAYMNWVDRFIPPRPRRVMVWDGFWTRNNPRSRSDDLNRIIETCRTGGDLTPYLSRRIHTQGFTTRNGKRGIKWADGRAGDKDLAINAYEVHHLHLRPANSQGRHPGGDKTLLYVGVSRTEMLLLMLGDHNSFNDGTLHQAVSEHRLIAGHDLKGILPPRYPFSSREGAGMLRHGLSTHGTIGERLVLAGLISIAGTGPQHTRHADRIGLLLEEWDRRLESVAGREAIREEAAVELSSGPFEWFFWYGDFGLFDQGTEKAYCLVPWRR
jgi:hypothetical protein